MTNIGLERARSLEWDLDMWIALACTIFYGAVAIVLLPTSEYLRMLGGAAAIFALAYAIAARFGRGPLGIYDTLFVFFGAAVVLVVPGFPAMGGTVPADVPLGMLGAQVALLVYASRRWTLNPRRFDHISLIRAWKAGLVAAVAFSLLATLPIGYGLLTVPHEAAPMLLVYPAYFVGFLLAASAYWVLQRIGHLAFGCQTIGLMCGLCAMAAIGPVASFVDHDPLDLRQLALTLVACGALLGPPVALVITSQPTRSASADGIAT